MGGAGRRSQEKRVPPLDLKNQEPGSLWLILGAPAWLLWWADECPLAPHNVHPSGTSERPLIWKSGGYGWHYVEMRSYRSRMGSKSMSDLLMGGHEHGP